MRGAHPVLTAILSPLRPMVALAPAAMAGGVILAGLSETAARAQTPGALADVLAWPGFAQSLALSAKTGVLATAMSLGLTLIVLAMLEGRARMAPLRHVLGPLLALPHAAAALGFAMLIAPSGWIARALSPWATGWTRPPDLMTLNDPGGWALVAGLVIKEVPFLLLMGLAAMNGAGTARARITAASHGYGRWAGFMLAVLPQIYGRMRLSVWAVLTFSMTVVDMGAILGPSRPAPLAVQVAIWAARGDPAQQAMAAAAALVLSGAVLAVLGAWAMAEWGVARLLLGAAIGGVRLPRADKVASALATGAGYGSALTLGAAMGVLALWSLAGPWEFSHVWPDRLGTAAWLRGWPSLGPALGNSLSLGLATAGGAVLLALAAVPQLRGPRLRAVAGAVYLPLIVPQVAVVPGMAVLSLRHLGAGWEWPVVAVAHLAYALPYAMLALAPAFDRLDPRLAAQAAALGHGPVSVFFRVHLPLLAAPALAALAVTFAVSMAQYLPTLILAGGRLPTLATEAVALSSGGDRRLTAAMGLAQAALPMLGFVLATTLPRVLWRNRRGML